MFMDTLIKQVTDPATKQILEMIISQLNFLLCLVQDVLDMKTIESQKYEKKCAKFSPASTLKFIEEMFKPHSTIAGTELITDTVSITSMDSAFLHNHN